MEIVSSRAPEPVGPYSHARRAGDLLFLSGVGPRERGVKKIPGVELDEKGDCSGAMTVRATKDAATGAAAPAVKTLEVQIDVGSRGSAGIAKKPEDIVKHFPMVMRSFNSSLERRTCKKCKHVMEFPANWEQSISAREKENEYAPDSFAGVHGKSWGRWRASPSPCA